MECQRHAITCAIHFVITFGGGTYIQIQLYMCLYIYGHTQTNRYKCNIDINNNKKSHAPACGGFPEARHFPSHYRSCHFELRLHYILVQSETKVNEKLGLRNYISCSILQNIWFRTFETKTDFCVEAYLCVSM